MIRFTCHTCGTAYSVSAGKAGKVARCAKCGARIHVPEEAPTVRESSLQGSPQSGKDAAPTSDLLRAVPEAEGTAEPTAPRAVSGEGTPPRDSGISAKQPSVRRRLRRKNQAILLGLVLGSLAFLGSAGGLYWWARRTRAEPHDLARMTGLGRKADRLLQQARVILPPEPTLDAQEEALQLVLSALECNREILASIEEAARSEAHDARLSERSAQAQRRQEMAGRYCTELLDDLWPRPGNVNDMYRRVRRSVPAIRSFSKRSGTGFLIHHRGSYYVVTSKHVVEGARDGFRLSFSLGVEEKPELHMPLPFGPAALRHVHRRADLAAIDVTEDAERMKAESVRPLRLASHTSGPTVGDRIWLVGHPDAPDGTPLPTTLVRGNVTSIAKPPNGGLCLGTNAPIDPRNSGGPVFNMDGRVIGIAACRSGGADRTMCAVHVTELHSLLTSARQRMGQPELAQFLGRVAAEDGKDDPPPLGPTDIREMTLRIAQDILEKGYRPCQSPVRLRIAPGGKHTDDLDVKAKRRYAILAISPKLSEVEIEVRDLAGVVRHRVVRRRHRADAFSEFMLPSAGSYRLVVRNRAAGHAQVLLGVYQQEPSDGR